MPKANVAKQMVLNFLCRNQSVAQPTQLFLALYSTNPTDADVGTEANYEGYQRQAVTFGPRNSREALGPFKTPQHSSLELCLVPVEQLPMPPSGPPSRVGTWSITGLWPQHIN